MQLALDINLTSNPSFDNFVTGQNAALVAQLQQLVVSANSASTAPAASQPMALHKTQEFTAIYLWGAAASGKTHLLKALSLFAIEHSCEHSYVDLQQAADFSILRQLNSHLICLDNLDAIVGQPDWEEELFHLFNRHKDKAGKLVVAASKPAASLGLSLADLSSRLAWGLTYQVQALSDEDKLLALQTSAHNRGMHLPVEVGTYLLTRGPRSLSALMAILDQLDAASLSAQHKLTQPFVRRVLNW